MSRRRASTGRRHSASDRLDLFFSFFCSWQVIRVCCDSTVDMSRDMFSKKGGNVRIRKWELSVRKCKIGVWTMFVRDGVSGTRTCRSPKQISNSHISF